jgi:Nucleotidyltransferase of unknown function (DUF6036)
MNLTKEMMLNALQHLDQKLDRPVTLIIGGGGAMLLAHQFPLVTTDLDGIPAQGVNIGEIDSLVKQVAIELKIPPDWLNPYYSTFTHVLPSDYGSRLQSVCSLAHLTVLALSKDDLLIMKCFAGRLKDRIHAKALIEGGARVEFVEKHLEELKKRNIPKATQALDFLDEILSAI